MARDDNADHSRSYMYPADWPKRCSSSSGGSLLETPRKAARAALVRFIRPCSRFVFRRSSMILRAFHLKTHLIKNREMIETCCQSTLTTSADPYLGKGLPVAAGVSKVGGLAVSLAANDLRGTWSKRSILRASESANHRPRKPLAVRTSQTVHHDPHIPRKATILFVGYNPGLILLRWLPSTW